MRILLLVLGVAVLAWLPVSWKYEACAMNPGPLDGYVASGKGGLVISVFGTTRDPFYWELADTYFYTGHNGWLLPRLMLPDETVWGRRDFFISIPPRGGLPGVAGDVVPRAAAEAGAGV